LPGSYKPDLLLVGKEAPLGVMVITASQFTASPS